MDIDFVLEIIAYAGGSAAVAYFLFTWLGKNTIENWFSQRMEAYKKIQAQELERYKYEINALFNRVTKIHEKEFEILPLAWKKLQNAMGKVGKMASPIQHYPDLKFMSATEFKEFLETCKLREHDKEKLVSVVDKNKFYQERIFWYELQDTQSSINELHNYLLHNKIFLSKDLFRKFGEADKMLYDASLDLQVNHLEREGRVDRDVWKKLNTEIQQIADQIELLVQERLHYTDA